MDEYKRRFIVSSIDLADTLGFQTCVFEAHPEKNEPLYYLKLDADRSGGHQGTLEETLTRHRHLCVDLFFGRIPLANYNPCNYLTLLDE